MAAPLPTAGAIGAAQQTAQQFIPTPPAIQRAQMIPTSPGIQPAQPVRPLAGAFVGQEAAFQAAEQKYGIPHGLMQAIGSFESSDKWSDAVTKYNNPLRTHGQQQAGRLHEVQIDSGCH
jgi:hypothetical protein